MTAKRIITITTVGMTKWLALYDDHGIADRSIGGLVDEETFVILRYGKRVSLSPQKVSYRLDGVDVQFGSAEEAELAILGHAMLQDDCEINYKNIWGSKPTKAQLQARTLNLLKIYDKGDAFINPYPDDIDVYTYAGEPGFFPGDSSIKMAEMGVVPVPAWAGDW